MGYVPLQGHAKNFDKLQAQFTYKEEGELEHNDYARVQISACSSTNENSCSNEVTLHSVADDQTQLNGLTHNKKYLEDRWVTSQGSKTQVDSLIEDPSKNYLRVEVTLRSQNKWSVTKKCSYVKYRHYITEYRTKTSKTQYQQCKTRRWWGCKKWHGWSNNYCKKGKHCRRKTTTSYSEWTATPCSGSNCETRADRYTERSKPDSTHTTKFCGKERSVLGPESQQIRQLKIGGYCN